MAGQRKELGKRIAEARQAKRWKQKELAAAVHVEPTTVSRWETGRHAPDIDVLEEIARATDKPIAFFLDTNVLLNANGHREDAWPQEWMDEVRDRFDAIDRKLEEQASLLRRLGGDRSAV